jgi:hypothetical protein
MKKKIVWLPARGNREVYRGNCDSSVSVVTMILARRWKMEDTDINFQQV